MLIANKASQSEAEAGTDDIKYMTALKVLQSINNNALASKQMSIKTGTVNDNGTISQTAGYSNYLYFVSVNSGGSSQTINTSSGATYTVSNEIKCSVNQSTRKVTCKIGGASATANYLEIAWN